MPALRRWHHHEAPGVSGARRPGSPGARCLRAPPVSRLRNGRGRDRYALPWLRRGSGARVSLMWV